MRLVASPSLFRRRNFSYFASRNAPPEKKSGEETHYRVQKKVRTGFLIALDTMVRYWAGMKRYIVTGIDTHSKIAFARMYPSKHSKHAADFLRRLHYLFDGKIENIQTDNGSEFVKEFEEAAEELKLPHYLSRPKTPTDNPFENGSIAPWMYPSGTPT